MIITKHEAATGSSARVSLQVTSGKPERRQPSGDRTDDRDASLGEAERGARRDRPDDREQRNGNRGATRLPSRMPPATSADSPSVGRLGLRQAL